MKKKNILIILILIVIQANAQKKDFYVSEKGDTLYVRKVSLNYDHIRIVNDKKRKRVSHKKVKSIFISREKSFYEKVPSPFFWDRNNPNKKVFLIRLTNGKIKIFADYDKLGNDYFISKNNSKLELIYEGWDLKFKGDLPKILKKYISDNQKILNEFKLLNKKVKGKEILSLIRRYNNF